MDSPILDIPFRVTDTFGSPRPDYPSWTNHLHEGLDLDSYDDANSVSVPVYATQDGAVELAQNDFSPPPSLNYGKHIIVNHPWYGETYKTWYCHLGSIEVKAGDQVKRGQRIGVSDATGTKAIHLHLNLQHIGAGLSGYYTSDVVDPLPFIHQ